MLAYVNDPDRQLLVEEELWAIRTKDGNRIQPELNVDVTVKANSTDHS